MSWLLLLPFHEQTPKSGFCFRFLLTCVLAHLAMQCSGSGSGGGGGSGSGSGSGGVSAVVPWRVKGEVVRGFGRGSKALGIPTANLAPEAWDQVSKFASCSCSSDAVQLTQRIFPGFGWRACGD